MPKVRKVGLCALLAVSGTALGQQDAPVRLADVVVSSPIIESNTSNRFSMLTTAVTDSQVKDLGALDLAAALRMTPGVQISRYNEVGSYSGDQGGNVYIRGMGMSRPGSEIKTYIDGLPVYMGLWNHPLMDLLPLNGVKSIQIQKGAGSGIVQVEYDQLVNCTTDVPLQQFSPALRSLSLSLRRIDPRQDMIYQITVVDAVGNKTIRRDTIGGFTLAAYDAAQQQVAVRLERDWQADSITYGDFRCDSITLTNNGLRRLEITQARMRGNLNFSIPPTQLPFSLAPGESRKLMICLLPTADGNSLQADTLELSNQCGIGEEVALKLPVTWLNGTGQDGCNNAFRVQMFAAARRTFLGLPTPNPGANSTSRVDVALAQPSHVSGLTLWISKGTAGEKCWGMLCCALAYIAWNTPLSIFPAASTPFVCEPTTAKPSPKN